MYHRPKSKLKTSKSKHRRKYWLGKYLDITNVKSIKEKLTDWNSKLKTSDL